MFPSCSDSYLVTVTLCEVVLCNDDWWELSLRVFGLCVQLAAYVMQLKLRLTVVTVMVTVGSRYRVPATRGDACVA